MAFKKFFGYNKDNKKPNESLSEIEKIKTEIEKEDRIFQQELQAKDKLLQKFELDQLKQLCINMLGREPEPEYFEERETGKQIELPLYRNDYTHFIIEELRLSEIEKYAINNKIIPKTFFEN